MAEFPSMDDILAEGRARERRSEIVLGVLLIGGGLAWRLGLSALLGGSQDVYGYAAVGLGVVLLLRGVFGGRRAR